MRTACLLLVFAGTVLRAQFAEPRVGLATASDGSLLAIRGLPANFIVNRMNLRADAVACSDQLCAIRSDDVVRVLDAGAAVSPVSHSRAGLHAAGAASRMTASTPRSAYTTLEGAAGATLGFSRDGALVAVFRPQSSDISILRAGAWRTTPVSTNALAGEVESIALDGESARLVVRRDSSIALVRVRTSDGAIEDDARLEDVTGPVMALAGGGIAFASEANIVIQDATGARTRVELPAAPARLAQLGQSWIAASTSDGRIFAAPISRSPQAYEVPEAQR
jgi:hypothetical protein